MRPFFLLLTLAVPAVTLPAFAQQAQKQIVVEAANSVEGDGSLRMIPPMGHTGGLFAASLSPRGDMVLTASFDQTARLWDVASGREVFALPTKGYATSAAFSPDGKRALVGSNNFGILYLWDVATGRVLHEMEHPNDVEGIAFNASGTRALTGCYDGLMRLWNLEDGSLLREMEADPAKSDKAGQPVSPDYVAFGADGKKSIALTNDKRLMQHDLVTGKLLSSLKLDFTPGGVRHDGRFAVGSTEEAFIIWDVNAAREASRFAMPKQKFSAATAGALSRDGKLAAAGTGNGELHVWDIASGRLIAAWRGHKDTIFDLTFSEDNATLVSAGYDKVAHLWRVPLLGDQARRAVRAFRGYTLPVAKLLISPDGRSMLARTGSFSDTSADSTNVLQLSDIATGRRLRHWEVPGLPRSMVFSHDSRRVLVSVSEITEQVPHLFLFDVTSDQPIREYKGFTKEIYALAFSPDGGQFLAGGGDTVLRLWNTETAQPIASLTGSKKTITNAVWSADGTRATSLDYEGIARTWDMITQRQIKQWAFATPDDKGNTGAEKTVFTTDGRFLLSAAETDKKTKDDGSLDWRNVISLFDVEKGTLIRVIGKARNFANSMAISDDGKTALTADVNEKITQMWDLEAGREVKSVRDPRNSVTSSAFAHDGQHSFVVQYNGSIAVRDIKSGDTVLTYLPMENGDWMAFTPDGLFDGSPGGIERVAFEKNGKTFALEQFAERFYRPGLVRQIMTGTPGDNAGNTTPDASAGALLAQGAPPLVKIVSPQTGAANAAQVEVTVEAREQNKGGVKAIRLYQNGRLVGGPGQLRGIVVEAAAPVAAAGATTQKFTVALVPGDNVFRAVAYSQTDLESAPAQVKLTYAAAQGKAQKPSLHVLAVGINEYRDATMNLSYARPDAEALVKFFKEAKNTSLFERTEVTSLFDEAASGAAIKDGLTNLATKAKPEDVVFIYMAGHGETAAAEGRDEDAEAPQNFYFLPADMRQMIMKERVRQFGISGPSINALIEKIPARKIVLIYDACKSGAAIGGGTRGAGDEQQALSQLARSQGIFVLTASTGQQYANEVKSLGHGILTYALLEGLSGKAAGSDSLVKVNGLFAYTDDRVPTLAKQYRGREQWPVSFGKGQNFPLVMKP